MKKRIVVLTGAGISAESGIPTFRDPEGLWDKWDPKQVASLHGWKYSREKVLEFHNWARSEMTLKQPNEGHLFLKRLESDFQVDIITQNIDDLHEKAGSTSISHLHGNIFKSRSTVDSRLIYDYLEDIKIGDKCEKGSQLRPDVVWFGEMINNYDSSVKLIKSADILIVIGTSLQVQPASTLLNYLDKDSKLVIIDPHLELEPWILKKYFKLFLFKTKITEAVVELETLLKSWIN